MFYISRAQHKNRNKGANYSRINDADYSAESRPPLWRPPARCFSVSPPLEGWWRSVLLPQSHDACSHFKFSLPERWRSGGAPFLSGLHLSVSLPLSWFLSGRFHLTWCFSPPQVFSSSSAFSLWISVIGFCASSSSFIPPNLPLFLKDRCRSERIHLICVLMDWSASCFQMFVGVFFPLSSCIFVCYPEASPGLIVEFPFSRFRDRFFVQSAFLLSLFLPLWYSGLKMKSAPTSALLGCDFRISLGDNTSVTIFILILKKEKRQTNSCSQSSLN